MIKNFFASITHNAISLIGTALAVASMVLILSLFTMQQFGFEGGPYLGILTYLILPMIFAVGLILIPVGAVLYRRKMRKRPGGEGTPLFPVFDLNMPHTRHWLLVFVAATMVNIIILASATYKGVEVMESVEFCGLACHSVMEPEHTAHARSPHSRVACADCHIGPGADWFVKSKLDGAWQLVSVALNLYPRPVPTPLHDLRPARDTCEQCHWPTKFVGDKLKVIKHYEEDEANTELTTALLLRVGGTNGLESSGIHWHVDPGVEIRYRSDETREDIYEVEFTDTDGAITNYADRKAPEEGGTWRTMDCVDCHNRPSHIYKPAHSEVDRAIAEGSIDTSLPFVKREGLRIVSAEYASHEEARTEINAELQTFYAENYPEVAVENADAIASAADALGDVFAVNVFPNMQVWWDTYPNHIGHEQSPGCTRCHARNMRTADREQISSDCDTCHVLLAEGEENPHIVSLLRPE
ncbi:MAG: NapC/NirT family cytochrome c [Gammaproteobacteria bacterium]|nr:NapC/NirT family cytochrome c [Gammaproteobacteria bacterium]MDH3749129.1 NapC/NirT family cytochrome c [Gammaproteobacteria bacterium]MDH3804142.1 NapC/NirT family cytochrome c [Gammaproteobacteria bacterium]